MEDVNVNQEDNNFIVTLVADVVAAYVSNNSVAASDLPSLITEVHLAFAKASGSVAGQVVAEKPKPAVNPKRSVTNEYIICLEDGKKFKSLKRHLMTHYNMTPEEYREKWGLDANYPMVASSYAEARSNLAKKMGLGQKRAAARKGKK